MCSGCGHLHDNLIYQNYRNASSFNLPNLYQNDTNFPPFNYIYNIKDNNNNINNRNIFFSNRNSVYNNNNYISNKNDQNEQNNLYYKNWKSKKGRKALKKLKQKYEEKRPFDWICNRCNNLNYSFRTFCNICKLPLKDNPYYDSNNLNL